MDIRKASDSFSVASQIAPDDMDRIAALGFRSILCNRPHGEAEDMPSFASVQAAAIRAGLKAAYLPVAPTGPVPADVVAFGTLFADLPKPVLAYCRTGNRSLATWAAGPGATRR